MSRGNRSQAGWNESARREYLTGFSKRKAARRAASQAKVKKLLAEEKIQAAKEQRKETKNYIKQLRRAKRMIEEKAEEEEFDDNGEGQEDDQRISEALIQTDDARFYGRSSAKVTIQISSMNTSPVIFR